MIYRALGVLSSDDGVSITFAEFHENAGKWTTELKSHKLYATGAINLLIQDFIQANNLQYQVALITVYTEAVETIFNGASIAATTGLPVITNLADIDKELGGNGEFYNTCLEKLGIDKKNPDVINKTVCIAFMGILRWREEYNFLSSVTGATRSSIGGAIWLGQDA